MQTATGASVTPGILSFSAPSSMLDASSPLHLITATTSVGPTSLCSPADSALFKHTASQLRRAYTTVASADAQETPTNRKGRASPRNKRGHKGTDPFAEVPRTGAWHDTNLMTPLLAAVHERGYTNPTKIQRLAIARAIAGRNVGSPTVEMLLACVHLFFPALCFPALSLSLSLCM
jgi:hypothetical protein